MFSGRLYDGITAHPHEVAVEVGDGALVLTQGGGWSDSIDRAVLKRLDGIRES